MYCTDLPNIQPLQAAAKSITHHHAVSAWQQWEKILSENYEANYAINCDITLPSPQPRFLIWVESRLAPWTWKGKEKECAARQCLCSVLLTWTEWKWWKQGRKGGQFSKPSLHPQPTHLPKAKLTVPKIFKVRRPCQIYTKWRAVLVNCYLYIFQERSYKDKGYLNNKSVNNYSLVKNGHVYKFGLE